MPFSIRPYQRFPMRCFITSYGLRNVSVCGLVLLVLALGGCIEWTVPPCKGTPFKTPCVGPCTVDVEPAGPTYTQVTMPLAVVIHDRHGTLHCQEIQQ
jgi:hypothetical protein